MLRATLIAVISVVVFAASPASATLPAEGDWLFDSTSATAKVHVFQAHVHVIPDKSDIYTVRGTISGSCKKNGITRTGSLIDFNVRKSIVVDSEGNFSGTRRSSGGVKGSAKLKGRITGDVIEGTVTAHQRSAASGKCQGHGKFRAEGERIA